MPRKIIFLILISFLSFVSACSTFIPEEDVDSLNKRYSGDYILLQDVTINELSLPKGTVVKLIIVGGDEWVKVYAYNAKEDLLLAHRFLILYMFEDDFPDKEFNVDLLDKELANIVKPSTNSSDEASKQKTNKRRQK
ncbi:MAG TPA: type II secretion system-associated lipoprotein [Spirochaetota bacterium]|nr:type II secretion system-associated lipoprotein [Spirochaetota bacterium]HOK92187.1 type II secretion system-associated lipoprotein [Spirochaetota bacterium]HPP94824.1 type II secretion system-associated lipoprotein [Spirochaetota bacterium]